MFHKNSMESFGLFSPALSFSSLLFDQAEKKIF